MKTFSGRPFSSVMTRRVLSIAATTAALLVTQTALADETPATESVEPPKTEVPATTTAPAAEPSAEVAEPTAPSTEPTVTSEPASIPAPAPAPAPEPDPEPEAVPPPAPAPAPVVEAPRFVGPVAYGPPSDRPVEASKSSEKNDETFRVGGLFGVGFPRPFAVEGFVKVKKVVGVGFEYSFLPDVSVAGTDVSFKGMAVDARVFPFKGGFFVGVRGGKQWFSTRSSVQAGPAKYGEAMSAETAFVNPRIGFLKTWESGITVGIDAGVQIPVSPSYSRESDLAKAGIKSEADKTYASIAGTIGNRATPTVDLLRVGFLF